MDEKPKSGLKTCCLVTLILAGVPLTIITVLFVMFFIDRLPDKDPDKRPVTARMTEIYGEAFTEISEQHMDGSDDITLWTLTDSSGTECHAARGQDYDFGAMVYRCYDDYRVMQQEQTPAVQRLLAQKDFHVEYVSGLGQYTAFNNEYPTCEWRIIVESYDDIAAAMTLAMDTVTAEDSRLPAHEMFPDGERQFWGSIEPAVRVVNANRQFLGLFGFSEGSEQMEFDRDALICAAQERFVEALKRKGEKLPDAEKPEASGGTGESDAYFYDRGE